MKLKFLYRRITGSTYNLWIYLGAVTLVYFMLMSNSFFYLIPQGGFDDALQLKLAESLTAGQWLGDYNNLTLAKGITYPVWLALLHVLDIPLWFGNALIYSLACLSFIFAIRQVIPQRWVLAGIYAFLVFNPTISPRAYRDSIAPALCLFVLAWLIGIFLSVTKNYAKKSIVNRDIVLFTIIGFITFPAWWFLREDSFWILPFVIGSSLVIMGYVLYQFIRSKQRHLHPLKIGVLLVMPFLGLLAAGILISSFNERYYGRFVINDFTSSEFAEAYGALTRIKDDKPQLTVPVSSTMREKAYKASPAFRELQPCLDSNGTGGCEFLKPGAQPSLNDYQGGWFFWALRGAADSEGYYKNAATAEAYYLRLAKELNDACDNGKLECSHPKRASLSPPYEPKFTNLILQRVPTAAEQSFTLKNAAMLRSYGLEAYSIEREVMSDYMSARYDSNELNFAARVKRKAHTGIAVIYQIINPVLLSVSLVILLIGTVWIRKYAGYWREILIGWGLVLLIALRIAMLAYVDVTSFPALNNLYFSSSYVIMFALEGLLIGKVICMARAKKTSV